MAMPQGIRIIDPGIGFPHQSIEEKKATYDFFRPLLKDRQSREEFEFPAQYMFKGVPDVISPELDPIEYVVDKMDEFGIEQALTGMSPKGIRAKELHPGRFHLIGRTDPNEGMDGVKALAAAKRDHDIVAAMCFPSGTFPQVAVNDKKMYPIYMKCVELGIPMCINGGIVGPRMPSWPQHVEHFDEVLYDFPELTMVMMHGGEPWDCAGGEAHDQVARAALHDERLRPEALPEGHHRLRQQPGRRQDHVLRVLPGRADPRASVHRHAERAVQGRGVAQVPARERPARVQLGRVNSESTT